MSVLSKPYFHNEAEAFTYLEQIVWASGVSCPHCGVVDGRVYDLSDVRGKPSKKNPEGAIRHGLKKCGECRKQFTVKVGTVFEHARMPLHKMLQAVYLMTSSKKGISAHQLHRVLEITYKSAWFLAHRIREAMRDGNLDMMGGDGAEVMADETYIGNKPEMRYKKRTRGSAHKMRVVSLLDKSTGKTRSFYAREDQRGLRVIGSLLTATRAGRQAAAMLNGGAVQGLSFGYRVQKAAGQKPRTLLALDVAEISLVTHPMQPLARVHIWESPISAAEAA